MLTVSLTVTGTFIDEATAWASMSLGWPVLTLHNQWALCTYDTQRLAGLVRRYLFRIGSWRHLDPNLRLFPIF